MNIFQPTAYAGVRIIETTFLPMKHSADEIVPIHFHPLARWVVRLFQRRHPAIYFMRGKPIMVPRDMFVDQVRGVIYCHPSQAAEIRRQLRAR